jgi:hypothetical protein
LFFKKDIRLSNLHDRLEKDIDILGVDEDVAKQEFVQYKSFLNCDKRAAYRLFERIRQADNRITWTQFLKYIVTFSKLEN